jgi:hypothetical protein
MTAPSFTKERISAYEWAYCFGKTSKHLVLKARDKRGLSFTACGQHVVAPDAIIELRHCCACLTKQRKARP